MSKDLKNIIKAILTGNEDGSNQKTVINGLKSVINLSVSKDL
jgi:hypothetical protein